MHNLLTAIACAGLCATTLQSQALTLVSTTANGNPAAATVSAAPLPTIAANIGFNRFGAVSFVFELSAADVDGLAAFNAVVNNEMIGRGIAGLELSIDKGTFALVGAIMPTFSEVASVMGDAQRQRISFEPAEALGVDLGNPFSAAGQSDWLFGFAGMQSGERFTLTVSAVPEPSGWALALAGLCLLATVRRRRGAR